MHIREKQQSTVWHGELLQRGFTSAAILGGIVVCGELVISRAAPLLGDYAEWTYQGVLLWNVLQGHADAAYQIKNYPVPNSMTTIVLALLMSFLSWQVAAKVWLALGIVTGMISALQLQRAAGVTQRWQLLVFTGGAIIGTAFWFGFENFLLGTFVAIFFAALLLKGLVTDWKYGATLVLSFFCHMIPFGFALVLFFFYAMQNKRWRLLWQAIPSLLLTVGYFIGRAMHGDADSKAGMVESVKYGTPMFVAFKANSFLKNWGFVNPAYGQHDSVLLLLTGNKLFVALFLLNLTIALGALVLLLRATWQAYRRNSADAFIWVTIALFAIVGLMLPGAAAGISDPGGRMLQVASWCGILVVSTRRRWTAHVLGICAIGLVVANCVLIEQVAMKPPVHGLSAGTLPAHLREFSHAYYAHAAADYTSLENGRMTQPIFPTAMFLTRDAASDGAAR